MKKESNLILNLTMKLSIFFRICNLEMMTRLKKESLSFK